MVQSFIPRKFLDPVLISLSYIINFYLLCLLTIHLNPNDIHSFYCFLPAACSLLFIYFFGNYLTPLVFLAHLFLSSEIYQLPLNLNTLVICLIFTIIIFVNALVLRKISPAPKTLRETRCVYYYYGLTLIASLLIGTLMGLFAHESLFSWEFIYSIGRFVLSYSIGIAVYTPYYLYFHNPVIQRLVERPEHTSLWNQIIQIFGEIKPKSENIVSLIWLVIINIITVVAMYLIIMNNFYLEFIFLPFLPIVYISLQKHLEITSTMIALVNTEFMLQSIWLNPTVISEVSVQIFIIIFSLVGTILGTIVYENNQQKTELRINETRYQSFFTHSYNPVIYLSRKLEILDVNQSGREFLAIDPGRNLNGLNLVDYFLDPHDLIRFINRMKHTNNVIFQFPGIVRIIDQTESVKYVRLSALSLRSNHSLREYLFILDDLTEVKKIENQLIHANKMDTLGRLSRSITHDFKNLHNIILNLANLGIKESQQLNNDKIHYFFNQIFNTSQNASLLSRQLLNFSQREIFQPEILNINEVIVELQQILGSITEKKYTIMVDLHPDMKDIFADRGQMIQILMNLVINAMEAMPDGGSVRIGTGIKRNEYVEILVADKGVGMSKETLENALNPYYTTKPNGNGLGLSIVSNIISQLEGEITIMSELHKGTTIYLAIPLLQLE